MLWTGWCPVHLCCHREESDSFLSNTCSGLTLQLLNSSTDAQYPARCLSSCRPLVSPSRQYTESSSPWGDLYRVRSPFQPWSSRGEGTIMSSGIRLSWWVSEILLCEVWLQQHVLTPQLQQQQHRPGSVALLIMQVLIYVAKRVAGTCLIWTLQEWNRIRLPRCKEEALVLYF